LKRPALVLDPFLSDHLAVGPSDRGEGVMLVGIERDVLH
jgi:hypothetical protein